VKALNKPKIKLRVISNFAKTFHSRVKLHKIGPTSKTYAYDKAHKAQNLGPRRRFFLKKV
jgi:hypothetical protein